MSKILDVYWFCAGHGNVGIVRVDDGFEIKYYVGQCSGIDAEKDAQWIADWGSSFPKDVGDILFKV